MTDETLAYLSDNITDRFLAGGHHLSRVALTSTLASVALRTGRPLGLKRHLRLSFRGRGSARAWAVRSAATDYWRAQRLLFSFRNSCSGGT